MNSSNECSASGGAILASAAIYGAIGYIWGHTIAKQDPKTSSNRDTDRLVKTLETKNAAMAKEKEALLAQSRQLKAELASVREALALETAAKAASQEQEKIAQAKMEAITEELNIAKAELEKSQAELRQAPGAASPLKPNSGNGMNMNSKGAAKSKNKFSKK